MVHQGQNLKNQIKAAKKRQEDFAVEMGVSRNTLLIMLNKMVLKDKHRKRACEILGIDENVITNVHTEQKKAQDNKYLEDRVRDAENDIKQLRDEMDQVLLKINTKDSDEADRVEEEAKKRALKPKEKSR